MFVLNGISLCVYTIYCTMTLYTQHMMLYDLHHTSKLQRTLNVYTICIMRIMFRNVIYSTPSLLELYHTIKF